MIWQAAYPLPMNEFVPAGWWCILCADDGLPKRHPKKGDICPDKKHQRKLTEYSRADFLSGFYSLPELAAIYDISERYAAHLKGQFKAAEVTKRHGVCKKVKSLVVAHPENVGGDLEDNL